MFFFGRLGGLPGQWQAFIANPASFFSKLVDRHPDGSSIEPSDSLAALNHLRIPPELPECFGCDFLRACRVANYPRNGPGDAFVMNVEERFEIESVVEAGSLNRLAWRRSRLYKRRACRLCDSQGFNTSAPWGRPYRSTR